jgi:hypothetical protein
MDRAGGRSYYNFKGDREIYGFKGFDVFPARPFKSSLEIR